MTFTARDLFLLGCCAALLSACQETRSTPNAVPTERQDSSQVQLVVSDTAPAVGDEVRVTAVLYVVGDSAAASFTARLQFDSAALRYVGDFPVSDGAMRASNGQPTELRVAGAAVKGFSTGTLFAARFQMKQRGGLESLRLTLDELHDTRARDIRSAVRLPRKVSPTRQAR